MEYLLHDAGCLAAGDDGRLGRPGLAFHTFPVFTGCAFLAELGRSGGDGEFGGGHACNLVVDGVRLMLKRIVGLPGNELCLYCAWEWRCSEQGWRLRSVHQVR